MKRKKIVIPVIAAAIAAATIGSISVASAEGGVWAGKDNKDEMRQAIEDNDFDTWKQQVDRKSAEFSTEENFDKLKEAHDLMQAGKTEEARAIKEEMGMMKGPGKMHGMKGEKDEMRQAVQNNDFAAWKTAMEDNVIKRLEDLESKINEDTFNELVRAHNLMQEGKRDEAKQIHEDLGLSGGPGMHGQGLGQKKGMNGSRGQ
ncbi:hypothetical protein ACFL2B_01095 [Patescibacteria group bacterium]